MKGWNGRLLRVDLSRKKMVHQEYSMEFARKFVGGRGFAVKLLWDELEMGTSPLSPENMLIFAVGPYTGFNLPNSGKMVVASKSPLTGGYGDGNLGTMASPNMRRCGIDGIILTGKAESPSYLWVEGDEVEIRDASEIWGLDSFEAEDKLKESHGQAAGTLLIGQSGENLCRLATIVSQRGRAGGRPGMGAVMGSKNLKAIVLHGTGDLPAADEEKLNELGREGFREIPNKDNYSFWKRQGTMATVEWCQNAGTLPTRNFSEGVFESAECIDGNTMEEMTVKQKGCPNCNMICGNVVLDSENMESELDYENVVMLGSNVGIGDLKEVATLNRMCDQLGLDTIGAGNVMGFAMEASQKGLVDLNLDFGDFEGAKQFLLDLAHMEGAGTTFGLGTKRVAEKIGGESIDWAMQVKGLECSAYDCHLCPGMALSFGTSPIGAHHKDAWVISWEISSGTREEYGPEKADKVIEFQRIRGGMFESLVGCRFPWIELGFELEHYPKYFEAATGISTTLDELWEIGDRIYALIRAFWVREFKGSWSREMDYPPKRWFKEPLTKGALKGKHLYYDRYGSLLQNYYEKRGWDERGIPKEETMRRLGLSEEARELSDYVDLR
ncbi:MAG: aldehyde ferredoxin oxidoreductase family protein [Candidatus Bathyarchaeia archaeon]